MSDDNTVLSSEEVTENKSSGGNPPDKAFAEMRTKLKAQEEEIARLKALQAQIENASTNDTDDSTSNDSTPNANKDKDNDLLSAINKLTESVNSIKKEQEVAKSQAQLSNNINSVSSKLGIKLTPEQEKFIKDSVSKDPKFLELTPELQTSLIQAQALNFSPQGVNLNIPTTGEIPENIKVKPALSQSQSLKQRSDAAVADYLKKNGVKK